MTNICMPLLNAESSMKIYKCAPRGWPISTSTGDGGMGYIYWYDATYHYGTYGGGPGARWNNPLMLHPVCPTSLGKAQMRNSFDLDLIDSSKYEPNLMNKALFNWTGKAYNIPSSKSGSKRYSLVRGLNLILKTWQDNPSTSDIEWMVEHADDYRRYLYKCMDWNGTYFGQKVFAGGLVAPLEFNKNLLGNGKHFVDFVTTIMPQVYYAWGASTLTRSGHTIRFTAWKINNKYYLDPYVFCIVGSGGNGGGGRAGGVMINTMAYSDPIPDTYSPRNYKYKCTNITITSSGDSIAFVGNVGKSLLYPPFGNINNIIDYDHFIANKGKGYLDVFRYIYNNKLYPVYDEASGYARFPIQTKTWQEIFNDPDLTA